LLKKNKEIDYKTPVYLDSPMASRITMIYKAFHDLYNDEYAAEAKTDDPLDFPGLHIIENSHDGKRIDYEQGAKVIMAGNGMMSGGKILNHAIQYLPRKYSQLLIVGYQAEGTYGRQILEGHRNLIIENNEVHIRATVHEIKGLSAHADQTKLLKWIGHIQGVQHIALVHGEEESRHTLAQKIIEQNHLPKVHIPLANEELSF
jgi:metallo-beta-lactamase family protein